MILMISQEEEILQAYIWLMWLPCTKLLLHKHTPTHKTPAPCFRACRPHFPNAWFRWTSKADSFLGVRIAFGWCMPAESNQWLCIRKQLLNVTDISYAFTVFLLLELHCIVLTRIKHNLFISVWPTIFQDVSSVFFTQFPTDSSLLLGLAWKCVFEVHKCDIVLVLCCLM